MGAGLTRGLRGTFGFVAFGAGPLSITGSSGSARIAGAATDAIMPAAFLAKGGFDAIFFAGVFFASVFFAGVVFAGAFVAGAFFGAAFLTGIVLAADFFATAFLTGAFLTAFLTGFLGAGVFVAFLVAVFAAVTDDLPAAFGLALAAGLPTDLPTDLPDLDFAAVAFFADGLAAGVFLAVLPAVLSGFEGVFPDFVFSFDLSLVFSFVLARSSFLFFFSFFLSFLLFLSFLFLPILSSCCGRPHRGPQ